MVKHNKTFNKQLGANISWILILLLVAGSSFLLGSSINNKSGEQQVTTESSIQTQSIIGDISNTLQKPPSTVAPTNNEAVSTSISSIININTASLNQLDTLPGIGPAYAQAIINYRHTNGPFVHLEDIQKVKGIGPKTFEKLKSRITI